VRFCKRPIVVDAHQLLPPDAIPPGVTVQSEAGRPERFFVKTLEGEMEAIPGDWIITGIANERYPCKDSIFKATYYAVDGDPLQACFATMRRDGNGLTDSQEKAVLAVVGA